MKSSSASTRSNHYDRRSRVVQHKNWSSLFTPRGHHNGEEISRQENIIMFEKWPFPHPAAKKLFVDMELSQWSCTHIPEALDSRLPTVSRLITTLFLLDDVFDEISLEEGRRRVDIIMDIVSSGRQPEPLDHVGILIGDAFKEMRQLDPEKVRIIEDLLGLFLHASTDPKRGTFNDLDAYLEFREVDTGIVLCRALAVFAMDLSLTDAEFTLVRKLEVISSAHISLVNDLFSWDREELLLNNSDSAMPVIVVNSVSMIMSQFNTNVEGAKRYLALKIVEFEKEFFRELGKMEVPISCSLQRYIDYLADSCAGNKSWSMLSARYNIVDGKSMKPVSENLGFSGVLTTDVSTGYQSVLLRASESIMSRFFIGALCLVFFFLNIYALR